MHEQDYMRPIWTTLSEMSVEDKDAELTALRALWDWVDDPVKYFALRGGRDVCIVTRSNKRMYGVLGVVRMEPKELEARVVTREWNPRTGKQQDEDKTLTIGYPMVIQVETVLETEVVQDALANGGPSDEIARQLLGTVSGLEGSSDEDDSTGAGESRR